MVDMINIFVNVFFILLLIFIGFSVVKWFGGNFYLGVVLGMIFVYFGLMSVYDFLKVLEEGKVILYWDVFGLYINEVGY